MPNYAIFPVGLNFFKRGLISAQEHHHIMEESPLDIDSEFIKENNKINFKRPRNGGPHTKAQKEKRLEEVYRLHFEYGYSARKIADLMKINRNTVSSDLEILHVRIFKNKQLINPEYDIVVILRRLDIQRTRLREQLDKAQSFQEKLSLERMIYEIDSKILSINMRVSESVARMFEYNTSELNKQMEKNKSDERYLSLYDRTKLSLEAYKKVKKIMDDDEKKHIPY